jgi:prepilin-type N-terminal cleavage/methylation domain-containing protein
VVTALLRRSLRQAMRTRRSGFTLLELSVGLSIGGLALVSAAMLLSGLSKQAEQIEAVARTVDRSANAERLLRSLIGNLDPTVDSIIVRGDRSTMLFRTWCLENSGRYHSCLVRLVFRVNGEHVTLLVETLDAAGVQRLDTTREILRTVSYGSFRYLIDAGDGGKWSATWSAVTRPAAIGVILEQDTLILPVR